MAHGDHLKYQAKPKAGRQTLFRLTSYLVCDRLLLSVIGVLIVLSIAANLGGSYLLRPIINRYIIPGDFLGLGKMLGILIGVYLTGVFAVYVEYRLLNKIGQRTVARMREDLFRKMEQLPVGYFDTHQHGDLMSRYTNDMDRISDALTDSLSDMLSSALTVVGIFCLMLVISPILTLVTLVTVPLMFWSARGIVRKSRQYFKAQQAEGSKSVRARTEGDLRFRGTEPGSEGKITESAVLFGLDDACDAKFEYLELCADHYCGGFVSYIPGF